MVGNSLENDVGGAIAVGMRAIWVDRDGAPERPGVATVRDLRDLPALL
jgi:FMN phosphatase YigB (HAD superfamily)